MQRMSIDQALVGTDSIRQVRASENGVFWLAGIASEDGRVTIRCWREGEITEITPGFNVRSRVMEYGGGAYAVADGLVAWCDDFTKRIWLRDEESTRPLTPESARFRYGGLSLDPQHRLLLAVRENHEVTPEERSEIVALNLDSDNADGGRVLVSGADFYAAPAVHDGQLAWFQWMHPHMSWDEASVWVTTLNDPGNIDRIHGKSGVSTQHPIWLGNGSLAYVTDESGHWNWVVRHSDATSTWRTPHDCSIPVWVLDTPPACAVGDDLLATVVIDDGRGALALWHPHNGEVTYPLPGTAMIESLASHGQDVFAIAEWEDRPASLVRISPTGEHTELVTSEPQTDLSRPMCHWSEGPAGPVHSWFYPVPDAATAPPMLVLTHGGPTSVHYPSFDRLIQFWVSRGICVLDVNYSGSTGFGRAYRNRLKGQWGVLDVADVVAAAREVCRVGLADPERVAIAGGSAGGYTTLQALVTSDFFAAGISSYGIGDLRALVEETHKAESCYTFTLVAPWPEGEQVYRERSPITQLDRLDTPMLILQGLEDRVVPPRQAFDMAKAVRAKGLPLALVTFEHEGHGFRSLAARRQSLESQLSFLEQVLGMPLSDDIPVLSIENLVP